MTHQLTRRSLLRAAGVSIALPVLESVASGRPRNNATRRRMVAIDLDLGLHTPNLIPADKGRDYQLTPYLREIGDLREQFTVISGTSHPDVDGGHSANLSFLSAAPHPGSASFKNTISVDQLAARYIGQETRFGYLALSDYGNTSSISAGGVQIPGQNRPSRVFERLFLDGRPREKAQRMERLKEGQSVLDAVLQQSQRMRQRVSRRDQEKLDEFFDAVRDTETRLVRAEQWEHRPKPIVDATPPRDIDGHADVIGRVRLMYDLMVLAIQTDSTRLITYSVGGPGEVPSIPGVSIGYHNLSHHGRDPDKLKQLTLVELEHIKAFHSFLRRLHEAREMEATLLDRTMVLLGSHFGNASSHSNVNLPVIFAGGGFRHGQHLAFDPDDNYPLPNLFVSMLQRLGLPIDRFASSTGSMRGMELAG